MAGCLCPVSLTVCEVLPWPLTLPCPSLLTAPSCQHHLPQGMASIPFPLFGFPWVRLPAQGLAPAASVAGLTLGVIHSGKPPMCALLGHGSREVTVEKRGKAGKGGSWQGPPLLLETEISLWPLPRPPFSPHALIQTKYSGSWPHCLWGWMGMNSPPQAQPDLLGIPSSVSPNTFHAYIVLIPDIST